MNIDPEDDEMDAWYGRAERPKPPQNCPKCGAENGRRIVYGLPAEAHPDAGRGA